LTNHVALAAVGFAAFVFLGLVALAARATVNTRTDSSLLKGRRLIAEKIGMGAWERLQQEPGVLIAQVWLLRAFTLTAFCFTCWHLANAVFE